MANGSFKEEIFLIHFLYDSNVAKVSIVDWSIEEAVDGRATRLLGSELV